MKTRISGDKTATRAWFRERVRIYSRRAGLEKSPRVEFGPCEGNHSAGNKAEYVRVANLIRVDLSIALCRHDADDSAAHEVVHARWHGLPHTDLFLRRVEALRSGQRCGPRGSVLPDAFR